MSAITDMSFLFNKSPFNGDISEWNVSKVTNMARMFANSDFNGDLSKWNVSNVKNINWMFANSKFNGDLSNWDVSNVTEMIGVFENSQFNGDISTWDVSNVINFTRMFASSKFDGDISDWDVSSAEIMTRMFQSSLFNGNISGWNVSNVKNMERMFYSSIFNGNISKWDMSSVTNSLEMFKWSKSNKKDKKTERLFSQIINDQQKSLHVMSIKEEDPDLNIVVLAIIQENKAKYINIYEQSIFDKEDQGSCQFRGPVYKICANFSDGQSCEIFYGCVTNDRKGMVMSMTDTSINIICIHTLIYLAKLYDFFDFHKLISAPISYTYYFELGPGWIHIANNSGSDTYFIPLDSSSIVKGNIKKTSALLIDRLKNQFV